MDFDPKKNYYDILGVSENASDDEIKKAFRKAAVTHHPDKGGDKAKFQEINDAYQTIGDAQKRSQYDMYRKGGFSSGGFGGGFGGGGFQVDLGGVDLGDIMGDIFGVGGGGRRQRDGNDVQTAIQISFEDAYRGVTKTIGVKKYARVTSAKTETCSTCKGAGAVQQKVQTPFGAMFTQSACQTCGGSGKIYTKDGKRLTNGGLEQITQDIEVKVPGGIKDGVFIKYSGKGDESPVGGEAGDLYIKINIKKSDIFERQGNDLYYTADMTIFDLVLGGKIQIEHPEGSIDVSIPKGTQPNAKIKVANKGFGDKGFFSSRGDMYISPRISVPKKLSKEAEDLRQKLAKMGE